MGDLQEKQQLHISVRNLVEFIFREGSIDNCSSRLPSADAMLEGSRIHRKIQKSMGSGYQAEVPLSYRKETPLYDLTVEGRADGIFTEIRIPETEPLITYLEDSLDPKASEMEGDALDLPILLPDYLKNRTPLEQLLKDGKEQEDGVREAVWVDEIKGMYRSLDRMEQPYYVHKAQALCYAYIYARQNQLEAIGIQITYCNIDTEEKRYFRQWISMEKLKRWFDELLQQYRKWADFEVQWKEKRQASIRGLSFPFPYREGQRKLVGDVYRTILRRKNLFIQAPTGVGKTISTIFPAVQAVGAGLADRIFYLTAKTITAAVAKETFQLLREHGYCAKIIQITAKEKMCLCESAECNPEHCPYADGHYDRVNDAVFDLLQRSDVFTREELWEQARLYQVCPFEMSLDVASFADNIVCDYNYAFDPNVCLKRFFQEGVRGDYIFLVDEAHNLVERSRQMYSAELVKEDLLAARRIIRNYSRKIEKQLERCNRILLSYKRSCETYQVLEHTGDLYLAVMRLVSYMDEFLQKPMDVPGRKELMDIYFMARNFVNIYELLDDHYVVYGQHTEDGRFMIRLFCVDPSENLQHCIDRSNATIFFSATLLPIRYYKSLLSTKADNYAVYAHSVFSPEQSLILLGKGVSTKYTRRTPEEFDRIAEYIFRTVQCCAGNYMVFFPSYKMMEQVYEFFCHKTKVKQIVFEETEEDDDPCTEAAGADGAVLSMLQKSNMREEERERFLAKFDRKNDGTLVAFCVMGGIFGEGLDLKKDQLIGVIVVGTGLPQISPEREILKNYYDERSGCGFDYAFRYPGMNKVLQAAGRVIRTVEDRGVILLLDERFLASDYNGLFPREWENRRLCTVADIEEKIRNFWEKLPDMDM